MTGSKTAARVSWRGIPIALKAFILCLTALVALLLLLPPPPDNTSGGVTKVAKHVPQLRDTVDPLSESSREQALLPLPAAPVVPNIPAAEVSKPEIAFVPEKLTVPPPMPARKPDHALPSGPAPQASPGAGAQTLPWEQKREVARLPETSAPEAIPGGRSGLPSRSDIREWVHSQAWEFLGGVDAQGNILYRFELWLEAPKDMLNGIKSVSYEYDAPSATPRTRISDEPKNGFRARFGSLACAKEVTVIITMNDGSARRAVVDGCKALN